MALIYFPYFLLFMTFNVSDAINISNAFDHYWLELNWPFGYCSFHRGCRPPSQRNPIPFKFGIHGLWPVDRYGHILEVKHIPPRINIKMELENDLYLLKNMTIHWPDFVNYDNRNKYFSFWSHEWYAHGISCPKPLNTPILYFRTTVNLYHQFDLMNILLRNHISPGDSYPAKKFRNALESAHRNIKVILRCAYEDKYTLTSITLCVASDATGFISCKTNKEFYRNNCASRIMFRNYIVYP